MDENLDSDQDTHRSTNYSNRSIAFVIVILVLVWFAIGLFYGVISN